MEMLSVDINLRTCSQSTLVAVIGLIPALSQTTCELELHSISSRSYDKAVGAAMTT